MGFVGLSSCKSNQPDPKLQLELNKLREENATLKAENERLNLQVSNPIPERPLAPTEVAAKSPTPETFEDIQGIPGEEEIAQLAQLGVFDTASGKFNPKTSITRAEFVRWLVRANNILFAGALDKTIRLSETDKATFSDVPPEHADFGYIQGMKDAGFAVGIDEKTFKPDQVLTREEMLAIKVALDQRTPLDSFSGSIPGSWTDKEKISKKYWPAIYAENVLQNNANIERTFGMLKTLNPQAPVTRAQAALCISAIGDNVVGFTTAEDAIQKLAQKSLP